MTDYEAQKLAKSKREVKEYLQHEAAFKTYKSELGVIDSTVLGVNDHGIFDCWLHIDFGGSMQGFGGYRLDEYDETTGDSKPSEFGMAYIMSVMRVLGVDTWEKVKGRTIWVFRKSDYDQIVGIGSVPAHTKVHRVFFPKELAHKYYPETEA
jgi:hypothetical protein